MCIVHLHCIASNFYHYTVLSWFSAVNIVWFLSADELDFSSIVSKLIHEYSAKCTRVCMCLVSCVSAVTVSLQLLCQMATQKYNQNNS